MRYFADENYREILLSLQLVPELLQLDTHIVIVPGTAPTICQSLLLLANDHRGAAKAPLSQIPSDNSDRNFVFLFFFGSLKRICSNLRSSWFWLSMPSLKSSRWLISCLSAFSDERITDTCWFCIFSSLWLRLRLWISCSRRELRLATCAAERDDNVRGRRYEPPANKWEEKSKWNRERPLPRVSPSAPAARPACSAPACSRSPAWSGPSSAAAASPPPAL